MANNNSSSSSGIGFTGLLTILFVIAWSWWWVLSPTWIGFIVFVVLFLGVLFVASMAGQLK